MRDPKIFADAFNKYLFHGEQRIKPESLSELDTTELVIPYGNDESIDTVQKYRDVLKVMKTDGQHAYCILGVENQADIHYAMPVRNMLYDAMQFSKQVIETGKNHKAKKDHGSNKGEFLSGFHKTDKLIPVITLVIYWGADKWDGPISLSDMYKNTSEEIDKFLPEYRINLIAPEQISGPEFDEFKTELKEVLLYIKHSADKDKLFETTTTDDNYHHMSRLATYLLNAVTNSDIKIEEDTEVVDVNIALQGIKQDGVIEGQRNAERETAIKMIKDGVLSNNQIASYLTTFSVEEIEKLAEEVMQPA